ncbi:MAG: hypothetical protein R3D60_07335 [Paracoccaceae bacterium]
MNRFFFLCLCAFLLGGNAADAEASNNAGAYWARILGSYWWDNPREMTLAFLHETPVALLPGEETPTGLRTTGGMAVPPSPEAVSCDSFQVVRLDDRERGVDVRFPFRLRQFKSAVLAVPHGLFTRFGLPSHYEYWVAAMLPENHIPLFNASGIGISEEYLEHARRAGYSAGSYPMSDLLRGFQLIETTDCGAFQIFHVRGD